MSLPGINTIYGPGVVVGQYKGTGNYIVSFTTKRIVLPENGDKETLKWINNSLRQGWRLIHLEIKPSEIIDEKQ